MHGKLRFLPALVPTVAALVAATVGIARAHLMVEQHGTLKVVGNGAFLVISLPVSALPEADDNKDRRLSSGELRSHWQEIEGRVRATVTLSDASGPRPLEGIVLDLSPPHETPDEPATQLVVLGRFALADENAPLKLEVSAWGQAPPERSFDMAITRGGTRRQVTLTPERASESL